MKITDKVIEKAIENLTAFGSDLFWALIILIVGMKLANYLSKLAKKFIQKSSIDESVGSFLFSIVRIGSKVLVIFMAATQLGIAGSQFTALLASAGVAIGLALQGSLSNIAGGCLILLLKPFQVGDYVKEDSHGNEGTVAAIDLFYTRIQTIDNKVVVVPNGVITNASLTNVTRQEERLLDIRVGIGYDSDITLAKKIIAEIATSHTDTVKEDSIQVFVDNLADSCVSMGLRVWVPTDLYNPVRWDILEKIKLEFDRNGISIPYNQMDVHIIRENEK
ncbi:MAG: mechanosensitive ion channel [Lachnospiraceae bacterium]|nr:mechanosensitive ion channel [Lachnospiraceae bacterium]